VSDTALKLINGKVEEVPRDEAFLGIRFWPDEYVLREHAARTRFYGPRGSHERRRDDAFRARWGLGRARQA